MNQLRGKLELLNYVTYYSVNTSDCIIMNYYWCNYSGACILNLKTTDSVRNRLS